MKKKLFEEIFLQLTMPVDWTGKHSVRAGRIVADQGRLYPQLPHTEIEMQDLEEERVTKPHWSHSITTI